MKNEEEKLEEFNGAYDKKRKKGKLKIIIIIVVLVIILFTIVGIISAVMRRVHECVSSVAKPIIYVYPEEETVVNVRLGNPEKVTCSYPEYKEGWNVIAKPDGTLIYSETGRELYSLYWEGKDINSNINMQEGFVIKGEETTEFLEEKLEILGLTKRESEEFIVYWLPKLQQNKYNYIRFASMKEINEYMPLEIEPKPDTVVRVLMEYKALNEYIEIPEQELKMQERKGFTVVEWGGTEIK